MSSRLPALTPRGRLVLALGATLQILGVLTGAWLLTALGVIVVSLLAATWIAFVPAAALLWRRQVDVAVAVVTDGELVAGREFSLAVTVRNRGGARLGRVQLRPIAGAAIRLASPQAAVALGAREESRIASSAGALAAGRHVVHGAVLSAGDRFGVALVQAWFPASAEVVVLPRAAGRRRAAALLRAPFGDERSGPLLRRLRGLGGELRELRDHAPGDPFKQIAWKASARSGRLLVRELDRETVVTHQLLLDIGDTMREGAPGERRIDIALELVAASARSALDAGDRVGLTIFDRRVRLQLAPAAGPAARAAITEALLESVSTADPEASELTDAELVATVARYLRHQEGVDARLRRAPAIDDPAWSSIATGGDGRLYDLRVIEPALGDPDAGRRAGAAGWGIAADPWITRLFHFCRRRGIELPLRRGEPGRDAGMAAAIEEAARGRGGRRIVIVSDLGGAGPALGRLVAHGRRRGLSFACLCPSRLPAADERAGAVSAIQRWDLARRERAARRRVEAAGVLVVPCAGVDQVGASLARLAVAHGGRSSSAGRVARTMIASPGPR